MLRTEILHPGAARQDAPVIFGMGLSACFGEMAADGFRTASMLLCKLCGSLFAVTDVDDEGPFRLTCFEPQKAFFASRGFELLKALQRKAFRDVQHAFSGNGADTRMACRLASINMRPKPGKSGKMMRHDAGRSSVYRLVQKASRLFFPVAFNV